MVGSADLTFARGRIAGEPFDSIVARATFNGANVTIENIDARLETGHLLAKGNYNTETHIGDFNVTGQSMQLAHMAALSGSEALKTLTGTADFTARVTGNLKGEDSGSYEVTFDAHGTDVTLNGRSVGTMAVVGRTENKQLNVTLTTGIVNPAPVITARVDLAKEGLPATIEATFNGADLTRLLAIALPNPGVKLTGRATGMIKASGDLLDEDGYPSLAGLKGTAEFSELSFRVEDIALAAAGPFSVRLTNNQVIFDHTQFTGTGTNLSLDGAIAIAAGGKQNLNVDGRLNLRVLNGFSPDFFASGTADVAGRVSGSFEQPLIIGTASLSGASIAVLLK